MGCNERTFDELPPEKNFHVRLGYTWRVFEELTPLACLTGMRMLQWAVMGGKE